MRKKQIKNLAGLAMVLPFILFCVALVFALLRIGTSLPLWADIAIAVPAGIGLFIVACKWAEM